MKVCPKCNRDTPRFWKGTCNKCYMKEFRKDNPEHTKARDKKLRTKHKQKRNAYCKQWRTVHWRESQANRLKVKEIKTNTPCMDCRNTYPPECMDFDHKPGVEKLTNVSTLARDKTRWATIEKEIAKCEIVCANCHRIRTTTRLRLRGMYHK